MYVLLDVMKQMDLLFRNLMKRVHLEKRPTARQALRERKRNRANLSEYLFRWHLVPRTEAPMERVVSDTAAVVWGGEACGVIEQSATSLVLPC
ncbi:hypothetical protein PYCCODRAFT_1436757 [Trametes coccinea BRFM310]|uniref:Uncharacterized protein n=1 Tax=Trametes coccinea (strain BRFM310) TaxID=1353009 RepID=A0A1Y2IIH4_TRAC3|nr:hypothetical protein PYCCODRAFT_1436757 [Trametes coccinea BRFM310]